MSRKQSLALLHYSCPPVVGGVEEIVRQQASLFHRYFHPVKIIAGNGAQFSSDFPVEINPLLASRNPKILTLHKASSGRFDEIKALARHIEQYLEYSLPDFEVLIAHNVLTMPYNLPLTYALHELAKNSDVKVVSWNHDSIYFYEPFDARYKNDEWSVLKQYNTNIHYITISNSRAFEFDRLYGMKTSARVIRNGIDPIRFFRLDPSTVRLIQEQKLFLADLLIVQPSRLHPRKNIEQSIKVLKALKDSGLDARLLLTGALNRWPMNSAYPIN